MVRYIGRSRSQGPPGMGTVKTCRRRPDAAPGCICRPNIRCFVFLEWIHAGIVFTSGRHSLYRLGSSIGNICRYSSSLISANGIRTSRPGSLRPQASSRNGHPKSDGGKALRAAALPAIRGLYPGPGHRADGRGRKRLSASPPATASTFRPDTPRSRFIHV